MRSLILIVAATMLFASVLSLKTIPSGMSTHKMLAQLASRTNINMKVLKVLAMQTKRQCQMAQVKIMKGIKKQIIVLKESMMQQKFKLSDSPQSSNVTQEQQQKTKSEMQSIKRLQGL